MTHRPGHARRTLLRNYWQPVALVKSARAAAGEGGAAARRGPGAFSRRPRRPTACSIAMPAPRRRPRLRPARGRGSALPLPRLAFRHERQCLDTPAEPEGSRCASTSGSRPTRCREERHPVRVLGARRAAGVSALRLLRRAAVHASPSRATGTATGCRRSRSASIRRMPRGCTSSSRTRTRRRATAGSSAASAGGRRGPDDARCCASSTAPRSASSARHMACGSTTLRQMSDAKTHCASPTSSSRRPSSSR